MGVLNHSSSTRVTSSANQPIMLKNKPKPHNFASDRALEMRIRRSYPSNLKEGWHHGKEDGHDRKTNYIRHRRSSPTPPSKSRYMPDADSVNRKVSGSLRQNTARQTSDWDKGINRRAARGPVVQFSNDLYVGHSDVQSHDGKDHKGATNGSGIWHLASDTNDGNSNERLGSVTPKGASCYVQTGVSKNGNKPKGNVGDKSSLNETNTERGLHKTYDATFNRGKDNTQNDCDMNMSCPSRISYSNSISNGWESPRRVQQRVSSRLSLFSTLSQEAQLAINETRKEMATCTTDECNSSTKDEEQETVENPQEAEMPEIQEVDEASIISNEASSPRSSVDSEENKSVIAQSVTTEGRYQYNMGLVSKSIVSGKDDERPSSNRVSKSVNDICYERQNSQTRLVSFRATRTRETPITMEFEIGNPKPYLCRRYGDFAKLRKPNQFDRNPRIKTPDPYLPSLKDQDIKVIDSMEVDKGKDPEKESNDITMDMISKMVREKTFQITPVGYDSRYNFPLRYLDVMDCTPEEVKAKAVEKCSDWLNKS